MVFGNSWILNPFNFKSLVIDSGTAVALRVAIGQNYENQTHFNQCMCSIKKLMPSSCPLQITLMNSHSIRWSKLSRIAMSVSNAGAVHFSKVITVNKQIHRISDLFDFDEEVLGLFNL